MRKRFLAILLSTSVLGLTVSCSQSDGPIEAETIGSFGFDISGMDKNVAAGEDFYQYASGTWAKNTVIPADKSNYGMFNVLTDLSQERVKSILETAKDEEGSKIGDAYASYLDTETIESKGLEPIKAWLDSIRAIESKEDYTKILIEARKNGVTTPVSSFVGQDSKNPDQYILFLSQSGTGLPDRDMYIKEGEKLESNRAEYINPLRMSGSRFWRVIML